MNDGVFNRSWTLLTNHGVVLLYVVEHPADTVRQIGDGIGITERAAARILRDLRNGGYLHVEHVGRRNNYTVDPAKPLRHHAAQERGLTVGDLLRGLDGGGKAEQKRYLLNSLGD